MSGTKINIDTEIAGSPSSQPIFSADSKHLNASPSIQQANAPAANTNLEETQIVDTAKPAATAVTTRFRKVYLNPQSDKAAPAQNAPGAARPVKTDTAPIAVPVKPAAAVVSKDVQLAYAAGSSESYTLREMMARGAESVLYRAQCGDFTFCAKSIRRALSKVLGGSLPEGTEKLENVKYSTKLRHILNEYEISKKLFQPEPMPVVRMYGLRKVSRMGFEVGYDLLLEYLEGHDLADKTAFRAFSVEDKVKILAESILALEYVHHKSIIHLDIKPSNFMLVRGHVKLIDFGVSVMSGHRANAITGTGGYLSPEQICKDTIDERTDIFAFGVTFAVFFGGKPLVQPQDDLMSKRGRQDAKNRLATMEEPMLTDIPGLKDYPGIAELLRQCTIPRRESRPASCAILLHQLKNQASKYGFNL